MEGLTIYFLWFEIFIIIKSINQGCCMGRVSPVQGRHRNPDEFLLRGIESRTGIGTGIPVKSRKFRDLFFFLIFFFWSS